MAANSIIVNVSAMNITSGALIATTQLTFGSAGMQLAKMGQELAAVGQLDLAFQLYEVGGEIFALGSHLAEVATASVEVFSLGVGILGIARSLTGFLAKGGVQKIARLLKNLRNVSSAAEGVVSGMANLGRLKGLKNSPEALEVFDAVFASIKRTNSGQPAKITLEVVDTLPAGHRQRCQDPLFDIIFFRTDKGGQTQVSGTFV